MSEEKKDQTEFSDEYIWIRVVSGCINGMTTPALAANFADEVVKQYRMRFPKKETDHGKCI